MNLTVKEIKNIVSGKNKDWQIIVEMPPVYMGAIYDESMKSCSYQDYILKNNNKEYRLVSKLVWFESDKCDDEIVTLIG